MAGFISARNAQIDLLRAAFYTARRQAPGRTDTRLFRPGSADWDLPEQGDGGFFNNRADFLVREILDEIRVRQRSEEHTSELQSLMRISYAVFCLKKKKEQYVA